MAFTARTADKHVLYQRSVQDPPSDIRFIDRVFKEKYGTLPLSLREDFCGTALMCADWVRNKPQRTALGLDLHAPTLAWGQKHNVDPLGDAAKRVQLLQQNVSAPAPHPVDVIVAFNFSYCVFKTRAELLRYARATHAGLNNDGLFLLDIHGGFETTREMEETTRLPGFTYVWEQQPYDPVNGLARRAIHFRFRDGTEMRRAFTYDWRLWTLPELREVLEDAGFRTVEVFWEGVTASGHGNGVFRRRHRAQEEDSWIAYVAGWRR